MASPALILASSSPRRAELLRAAGIRFEAVPANVDERQHVGEDAERYVRRLAADKAARVAGDYPGRTVLGADTAVVLDGEVLGKPVDAADAAGMLSRLSGRGHLVLTGVCVIDPAGHAETAVAATRVDFRRLGAGEIDQYIATGEPMDKAGAYGIQAGARAFIAGFEGEHDTVVGLPMALVRRLLRA